MLLPMALAVSEKRTTSGGGDEHRPRAVRDALLGDSIQNFIEGLAGRFARMLSGWINDAIANGRGGPGSSGIARGDGANGMSGWIGDILRDVIGWLAPGRASAKRDRA